MSTIHNWISAREERLEEWMLNVVLACANRAFCERQSKDFYFVFIFFSCLFRHLWAIRVKANAGTIQSMILIAWKKFLAGSRTSLFLSCNRPVFNFFLFIYRLILIVNEWTNDDLLILRKIGQTLRKCFYSSSQNATFPSLVSHKSFWAVNWECVFFFSIKPMKSVLWDLLKIHRKW